jgi:hypothetical protein
MSDEIAYIGRNLNARTMKAVEDFQMEVSRIMREAAAAGALNGSRTYIHFGRDAEAQAAAARVLEIDPAFTISALITRVPKNSKLFIEGLRKAGLPE